MVNAVGKTVLCLALIELGNFSLTAIFNVLGVDADTGLAMWGYRITHALMVTAVVWVIV